MPSTLRSMVIVAVPDATDAVDRWREETCNDKPSIGVPAHVTLAFPFAPATQLDQLTIASLAEVVGEVAPSGLGLPRLHGSPRRSISRLSQPRRSSN